MGRSGEALQLSERSGKALSLSVIIPAYNEALDIGRNILEIDRTLRKLRLPYEIIVVDDGSSDLTGEAAKEEGAKVIAFSENHGKGFALRAGIKNALGDIVVMMDAGGTFEPHEIKSLIDPIKQGADIVYGTRFLKKSDARPYSLSSLNRFGNLLFALICPISVRQSEFPSLSHLGKSPILSLELG